MINKYQNIANKDSLSYALNRFSNDFINRFIAEQRLEAMKQEIINELKSYIEAVVNNSIRIQLKSNIIPELQEIDTKIKTQEIDNKI